jgi:SAM-dependent methyltransferase
MNYKYTPPDLPSFARWRDLYKRFPGSSILRVFEYEILSKTPLSGEVLDVGGGENALYSKHLPDDITLHSINIDPDIAPTHLLVPDQKFPIEDNTYGTTICLNTLEHVYDSKFMIDEIHRTLKPGGTVHITVPFIFRIHGHPDDYSRHTPSWWRETMQRAGFDSAEVKPLVWGRSTTAGMISGYRGLLPKRILIGWSHIKDILYAALMFHKETTYAGKRGERICGISPGWFISATKKA